MLYTLWPKEIFHIYTCNKNNFYQKETFLFIYDDEDEPLHDSFEEDGDVAVDDYYYLCGENRTLVRRNYLFIT